jgi:catechol 2,3-dioxygenase-like lactoylglutathione lyase family enzyme
MSIVGLDNLIFGVDDLEACTRYLTDYGLTVTQNTRQGVQLEALDGSGVTLHRSDDPGLPAALGTATLLRKTVYGVADQASLEAIATELARDRTVRRLQDGSIESVDDLGFVIGFQRSVRRALNLPTERVNAPGAPIQRPPNCVGADEGSPVRPRTLSHVVYFVPDVERAEAFYVRRLKFRCTDRFLGTGPFLQCPGSLDHHCLFLIQTPPQMKGCEHFTFHVGGPTELMLAGSRFVAKGYESFWGPGRHKMGSNWFWYFNSPLRCHVEYDADMDLHDESWQPRSVPISADASQLFLFAAREKWSPGGPPPPAAAH